MIKLVKVNQSNRVTKKKIINKIKNQKVRLKKNSKIKLNHLTIRLKKEIISKIKSKHIKILSKKR